MPPNRKENTNEGGHLHVEAPIVHRYQDSKTFNIWLNLAGIEEESINDMVQRSVKGKSLNKIRHLKGRACIASGSSHKFVLEYSSTIHIPRGFDPWSMKYSWSHGLLHLWFSTRLSGLVNSSSEEEDGSVGPSELELPRNINKPQKYVVDSSSDESCFSMEEDDLSYEN